MAFPRPDTLDYEEGLFEELGPRSKEVLYRLYNVIVEDRDYHKMAKGAHSQEEFRKILASEFKNEVREFLDTYEVLKEESVSIQSAIDYLNDNYEVDREKLDLDNRYELLILLYEEDLDDQLDELIDRTSIRSYATRRSYTLDQQVSLSRIDEKISKFHKWWNVENKEVRPIRVEVNIGDNQSWVVLKIYQEYSERSWDVFQFREEGTEDIPAVPEIEKVRKRPLKNMRLQVEQVEGQTVLTFTDSLQGWQRTLDSLFSSVFDVDDITEEIEEKKFEAAQAMEEDIATGIGEADDPVEFVHKNIDGRKDEALDRVEKLNLPDEKQQELRDKIETIEMSGGDISDDQSTSTEEFRLVAFSLEDLFNSVDGIQESFQDWLQKADRENQSFVLTIDGRPIQVSDGTWNAQGAGRISEDNQKALEIFFGETSANENNDN